MSKGETGGDLINKNMTRNNENLGMMEAITSTFRINRRKTITMTKFCAKIILIVFIISLILTGLIVYSATHCVVKVEGDNFVKTNNNDNCNNNNNNNFETTSTSTSSEIYSKSYDFSTITNNNNNNLFVPITSTEWMRKEDENVTDIRLPKNIIPVEYEIKLIPFLFEGNFTFKGEEKILLDVKNDTKTIILHADELKIGKVSVFTTVDQNPKKNISINSIRYDKEKQFVVFELGEELKGGFKYNLQIDFNGVLKEGLDGFYRSSYVFDNKTWWIAATQFQPTDARRAFPCFDEPALKATFKISIGRHKGMKSISNMPKIQDDKKSNSVIGLADYEWDHFEKSITMSTYLVAFVIVSNFEKRSVGNFSVWSRKDAISQADYSLEIGPKILSFYENYFQIKFPLPKIDMVALPEFSAGAMENWGLLTYRETAVLYSERESDKASLQRISTIVSHELAHQWFGNLVTPKWWTDLWLNEGFATYMEYIGTNAIYPEWKVLDQFVVHALQPVLSLDALKSSHEISIKVNNPNEINDIFDRISYAKGAALIRMMDNFLTNEVFRKGLTKFLKDRIYGVAEQDDLWSALTYEARSNKIFNDNTITIKEIMDTWTLQVGFPVITIERDYKNNVFKCKQNRFFLLDFKGHQNGETLWWVPLTYQYKSEGKVRSSWMKAEKEIGIKDEFPKEWLLVNLNQSGYYRVNYDLKNWKMLLDQLMNEKEYLKIPTSNRAQILDDAMNLAIAGILDYDLALNLTTYLKHETDYVPWKAALTAFDYLQKMMINTAEFEHFQTYVFDLTRNLYERIGFAEKSTDSQLTIYTRFELLWEVCLLGNYDCVSKAIKQFINWKFSPNPDRDNQISPNLKSLVYCVAIRFGGQVDWDFAWKRFLASTQSSDKEILLTSLGCTREIWILNKYLNLAITENSGIRKQDLWRVFSAVVDNPIGQDVAFRFLKDNWTNIKNYVGNSKVLLNEIVQICTSKGNTQSQIEEMEKLLKLIIEEDLVTRALEQSIEQAKANVNWKKKNFEKIVKWLKNYSKNSRT